MNGRVRRQRARETDEVGVKRCLSLLFMVVASAAVSYAGVVESQEPLVYESEGVSLTAPEGWMMYGGMRKHADILAVFCRLPYDSPGADNPRMVLLRQKAAKGENSPLARAYRDTEVLALMGNLKDAGRPELIEKPESRAGGCARFCYEVTRKERDKIFSLRSYEYVFYHKGSFYVLLCGSRPEYFEKYRGDFERAAESLRFTQ